MAEKPRRGRRAFALLLVMVLALLGVRLFGPGGSPAEKPEGPAPAPRSPAPVPAPETPPLPAAPALRGRVLDAGGRPVAGARVEALFEMGTGKDPVIAEGDPTGADGKWSLPGAPAAWEGVLLYARRGPLTVVVDLGAVSGGAADGMEMDLRFPAVFKVAGIVTSSEEGRPLGDMEIRVGELSTRTDSLGRFSIEGVPAKEPFPAIEVSGAGRKSLRRPLPADQSVDDLFLRVERE